MWRPTNLQLDLFRIAITVATFGALASANGIAVAMTVPFFIVFVMPPLLAPLAGDGGE